jgi:hypothetical protein
MRLIMQQFKSRRLVAVSTGFSLKLWELIEMPDGVQAAAE